MGGLEVLDGCPLDPVGCYGIARKGGWVRLEQLHCLPFDSFGTQHHALADDPFELALFHVAYHDHQAAYQFLWVWIIGHLADIQKLDARVFLETVPPH